MNQEINQINYLFEKLFPINRSLTGDGNRKTLEIINSIIPLKINEIKSGTKVFDWIIPEEWNIRSGWIKDSKGKIVDFEDNNLHVLGYSMPIDKKVTYNELIKNIYTLQNRPKSIPYRTSYYEKKWGFCMTNEQFLQLNPNETYHVFIDSEFKTNGSLTYGETYLKGKSEKEYLISTYICHPSLANDNLSGIVLTTLLADHLSRINLKHNYRIIFIPETIGAIAYLSRNMNELGNVKGGYVITTVAGKGKIGYKESFIKNSEIDNSIILALQGEDFIKYNFAPDGSDERQFSSPGFRIPMASVTKDKYYEYEQYHNSDDNLDFISAEGLMKTLNFYKEAIEILELNETYYRKNPYCEFQLGKYGLYPNTGGAINQKVNSDELENYSNQFIDALGWLSFKCDGNNSLIDIAIESKINIGILSETANKMKKKGLLFEISER